MVIFFPVPLPHVKEECHRGHIIPLNQKLTCVRGEGEIETKTERLRGMF